MLFVRRTLYYFFSTLLVLLLVATAWSAALNLTFSSPAKPEMWLSQSGFYDHFVAYAIQQSLKNQSGQGSANSDVTLNDPHVQQAVQSAFTPQVIQNSVNTFLNANYAWLQGKTTTPSFSVDLTQTKSAMATSLGNYAKTRAASLPKCTPIQLLQLESSEQTFNILNATCLPTGVTPTSAAQTVTQDAQNNQNFLSNPDITAQNLNQQNQSGSDISNTTVQKPYYETLSFLPTMYQWATRLPWILGGITLLCTAAVILTASKLRNGLRRTAVILMVAGVVVLLLLFVTATVIHRLETRAFQQNDVGQLQQSIVNVVHQAQSSLSHVDIWFGAAYVASGLIIIVTLALTRPQRGNRLAPRNVAAQPAPFTPATSVAPQSTPPAPQPTSTSTSNQTQRPPKPPTLLQL